MGDEPVDWNDLAGMRELFEAEGDSIAAVLMTPFHHPFAARAELPDEAWWPGVSALCRDREALLLVDDVRTTGSTLRGAVRLLRRASPECVVAAVVAVADDTARRTADVSLAARSGANLFLPSLPSVPVDRISRTLRICRSE